MVNRLSLKKDPMFYFYILAASKGISDIGNFLNMVIFNLYAYVLTGSAWAMGLFMAIRLFGGFFFGFFSGILADWMNRKTLMIFADIIRGVALVLLVLAPIQWSMVLLAVTSFILGSFGQVFNVALQSSIPVIVGKEQLVKANSLINALQSVGMVIGTLTAGIALNVLGYRPLFLFDAFTFFLSAVILIFLPIQTREQNLENQAGPVESKVNLIKEVKILYQYLKLLPILMALMFIRFIDTFGSASHNVGMPVFSAQLKPDKPSFYAGIIWASWAVGNLIGARGLVKWLSLNKTKVSEMAFGISTFFMSAFFILLFWGQHWSFILICALLAGVSDGISAICYNSRLQNEPDHIRGRIFGVSSSFHTVGFGIGMLVCSPLLDVISPFQTVAIMHGLPLMMCIWFVAFHMKRSKYVERKWPRGKSMS
ncbi:MFS transporter [Polycladomyces sp. WAk]|uniref:MFS transporter n=1 Tax=Polycladomyces zharkentensis TaxID=2807616 RepID=A0ABS2WEB0_9BACL|nr:MFS transporter [Polycladomyces sp. WAk]MBN2907915.1 MFS transporter [Polycladomyces sp. WAk]